MRGRSREPRSDPLCRRIMVGSRRATEPAGGPLAEDRSMRHRKKRLHRCAYCGLRPGKTAEHVIPRCLFGGNLPLDNVTIPVCGQCNGAKAKDDTYLRDMLVTDWQCSAHPVAQSLLNGPVAGAAQRNQSELAKAARKSGRLEPVHTKAGLYLGHAYAVPLDGKRIVRIFSMIVKGLYHKLRNERLPDACEFEVRKCEILRFNEIFTDMQNKKATGPYVLGTVFGCMVMCAIEDPRYSYWLLWFYQGMAVIVSTSPPGAKWEEIANRELSCQP
jgi:hypothetical protein